MGRRKSSGTGERAGRTGSGEIAGNADHAAGERAGTGSGEITRESPQILGIVARVNTVEIDPAQIADEMAALAAGLPPEPAAAGTVEAPAAVPGAAADEWSQFMASAVPLVAVLALPQWKLTQDEQRELAGALAGCLAQLFPDGLNGRYAPWFRLTACAGMIGVTRYAQHGKLPGFGPAQEPATDANATTG